MDIYELGINIAVSQTGPIVLATLIAASSLACVIEIGISVKALTVAGNMVMGRPAANGTGSTGTALQALDTADPAASTHLVTGAFATTQPTAPANPFREFAFPLSGGAGCGVAWGWNPGELIINTGGQLVLWLVSGAGTFSGYVKVAEGG